MKPIPEECLVCKKPKEAFYMSVHDDKTGEIVGWVCGRHQLMEVWYCAKPRIYPRLTLYKEG